MRKSVNILGVNIDKVTFSEAVDIAEDLLKTEGVSKIFTPNPEIVMKGKEDPEMRDILNSADLCTPDGIGVVYGSKILGDPVPERVAGFDLVCALLERISKTGEGVFLFGAKPGVAEIAKENMEKKYPGLMVSGTENGYFKEEDVPGIIEKINASGAKLLLVCLGAPKPMDIFGGNWLGYMDKLKEGLAVIGPEDTTVLLGDLSWALDLASAREDFDWINQIPGKKIILKGNHDYWWSTASKFYKFCEEY